MLKERFQRRSSHRFLFLKVFLLILALVIVIYAMKLLESRKLNRVLETTKTNRKAKIIKFAPKRPQKEISQKPMKKTH